MKKNVFLITVIALYSAACFVKAQNSDKESFRAFLEKNLRFILPDAFEPNKAYVMLVGTDWSQKCLTESDDMYRNTVFLISQIGGTRKPEKLQEALKKTEAFAQKNPKFFWAQYLYAMNLLKLQSDKLEQQWKKTLQTEPEDAYGYLLLALNAEDSKRKGFYEKSILSNPKYADAYYEYGLYLEEKEKNTNKAIEMYQKAIDVNQHADAYNNLGSIYLANQQFDKAKQLYIKALSVHPKNSKLHANKGVVEYYTKDYEGAKKSFNKAIELNAEYGFAYFMLGIVELETGDKTNGCTHLNKAKELSYQMAEQYIQEYCK
jgi:tetratricopeptide (TPR) repeat protein